MAGAGSDDEWYYKWTKDEVEAILTKERTEEIQKILKGLEHGADLDKWVTENPDHELAYAIEALLLQQHTIFNDPIHGPVKLHPLLTKIINTSEFGRLRNIKQLGGACYVYHGAIHTRFEHSIGVCYLAGEYIRMLQRNQPPLRITSKEVLCVEVAALCHDLGHGPFSHMFEKRIAGVILKRELKHEKLSQLIFDSIYDKLNTQKVFTRYGLDEQERKFIKELIHPSDEVLEKERCFLFEIVANRKTGIDVDKWDYFERDSKYLNVPTDFQARRLMSLSRVLLHGDQRRICYPQKELQDIYGMFHTRYTLHQRAYQHKTVKAIDQMIADAILAVKDVPLIHISTTQPTQPHTIAKIVKDVASLVNDESQQTTGQDGRDSQGPQHYPSQQSHGLLVPGGVKRTAIDQTSESADTETPAAIDQTSDMMERPATIDDTSSLVDQYLALTDNIIELIKHGHYNAEHTPAMKKAKDLITRLEQRDIYHRIARNLFPKWPKNEANGKKTDHEIEDEVVELLQYSQEMAATFREQYYIEVFPMSHGSLVGFEEHDPVEEVLFYSKGSPVKVLSKEQVNSRKSKLMMPRAFDEFEIRLYKKASSKDKKPEEEKKVKVAFKRWCEDTKQAMRELGQPEP